MMPIRTEGTKQIWLESLQLMSNVYVFAMHDGQKNTNDYIELLVTHMDQKATKTPFSFHPNSSDKESFVLCISSKQIHHGLK